MPAGMKICLVQFIGIISFLVIQNQNKNGWAFKKRFERDHYSSKCHDKMEETINCDRRRGLEREENNEKAWKRKKSGGNKRQRRTNRTNETWKEWIASSNNSRTDICIFPHTMLLSIKSLSIIFQLFRLLHLWRILLEFV